MQKTQHWDEMKKSCLPGCYLVKQDGLWGIFHEDKGLIQPCCWEIIRDYEDGYAKVIQRSRNGMWHVWGLVDTEGRLATPCRWYEDSLAYDHGQRADGSFVNGFAVVEEDRRFGYMDRECRLISPCIWDYSGSFDETGSPALVFHRDGNYERAAGEWGGQQDWYFYYYEYKDYQIHPDDVEKYCPRGYFYLLPTGEVLTPRGIVSLEGGDIEERLGRGWFEATPFVDGVAEVRDEEYEDFIRIDTRGRVL